MLLSDVSADYLKHIRHERGLSPRTCCGYASWVHHFQKWLDANGYPNADVSAFSLPVLRRYLYHLSSRGLRPRTVFSAFHPIRSLGDFLLENGLVTENAAKALAMPKKDAAQRLTVSTAEVRALLDAVERIERPRTLALYRSLLHVLVFTGLRSQEVLDLKTEHLNLRERSLLVASGKGSKSRTVYLTDDSAAALTEWLALRGECSHEWLWAFDAGRRIGKQTLSQCLKDVCGIAGLKGNKNVRCHSLRHFAASNMMSNGASIKVVQAALGHASIAQTATYLHLGEKEAEKMAQYAALPAQKEGTPPGRGTARQEPAEERRPRRTAFQQARRASPTRTARK